MKAWWVEKDSENIIPSSYYGSIYVHLSILAHTASIVFLREYVAVCGDQWLYWEQWLKTNHSIVRHAA